LLWNCPICRDMEEVRVKSIGFERVSEAVLH
jgi:hypothetical protein